METCCHLNSRERLSTNSDVKNSQGVNSNNNNKYLNLARELKNLWNMKMTVIPIVVGSLDTFNKELLQGLEDLKIRGQMENIQTTIY